jgi:hypothetical protein
VWGVGKETSFICGGENFFIGTDLLKNTGLFRVNKSIEIDENLLATVIAKYCQITIIFSYS